MSERTIDFVETLVRRFPNLQAIFEQHVADFEEVLPHLFFGELTEYAVDLFLRSQRLSREAPLAKKELKALLQSLEDNYRTGGDEIEELISVSFLEHLPRPRQEPGWEIRSLIGPEMTKQLEVIG